MKLKPVIRFLIFLIFSCQILTAQSIDMFVLASAGEDFNNENLSLSSTLGEWMAETISSENYILTQGFQQSRLTIDTWLQDSYKQWEVHIFPNPVEEHLYIHLNGDYYGMIRIELYDLEGRKMLVTRSEKPFDMISIMLDLAHMANGFYLLKITSYDFKYCKITRIEKQ